MVFVLSVAWPPSGVTTFTVIVSPALGLSVPGQLAPAQVVVVPGLMLEVLHVATTAEG